MLKERETKQEINLVKLVDRFYGEDRCRANLEKLRWPDGVECPRCHSKRIHRRKNRKKARHQYKCKSCRYDFSVTSGTIFHDSHLSLWKWFVAVYLIAESKKSVSANQLKRMLGTTYRTAWHLSHRIRSTFNEVDAQLLKGIVEADETFVGGKVEGMGRGYRGNKTVVVGAFERDGAIRLQVVRGRDRESFRASSARTWPGTRRPSTPTNGKPTRG